MNGYLIGNNDNPDGEITNTSDYDYPYSMGGYPTSGDRGPTTTHASGAYASVAPPPNVNRFASKPGPVFLPKTYQRPPHLGPPTNQTKMATSGFKLPDQRTNNAITTSTNQIRQNQV